MPNKPLFMSHNSTQLTAWSFFLAALANSERSRLENTEDKSHKGKTERQWNKEMEGEREGGGKTWIWQEEQEVKGWEGCLARGGDVRG